MERRRRLFEAYALAEYRSPSDSVDVEIPELPLKSEAEEEMAHDGAGTGHPKKIKPSAALDEALKRRKEALSVLTEQFKMSAGNREKSWLNQVISCVCSALVSLQNREI